MAKDFARLGYLVTDRPLSDDLIADLIHAPEDDEAEVGVGKWPKPKLRRGVAAIRIPV